ncbi:MAG: two-component regulator propeller domain-containing protein [Cyclonatronaceae bacterium]
MEGQVLPFTHYTPENELNPLPSAEVTNVYQDSRGFMWFAIYSSGIAMYDGVTLTRFGENDGLAGLYVWEMQEDLEGRLWVSSNAGVVVSERPLHNYSVNENIRFTNVVGDTPLINVSVNHNKLAVDTKGRIWIGTNNLGIVRYDFHSESELVADTLQSSSNLGVRALASRSDGSVWVSYLGGTLLKYEDDRVTQEFTTGSPININTLYESPDGTLWGGEQGGSIWRLIEHEGEEPEFDFVNSTATSNIPGIKTASDGTLWVASEGSGLQNIDPVTGSVIATYTRANGLLAEVVYDLFQDREDNIWIAQSGGVSKLRYNYKAFMNLSATSFTGEQPLLPSPSVNTVLSSTEDKTPCEIWAGTSEGGVACISQDYTSTYIQIDDGLTGNWVNGLAYDNDGRVWFGTSRGLNSISFTDFSLPEDASHSNEITIFGEDAVLSTYPANSVLAADKLQMNVSAGGSQTIESIWLPAFQAVYVVVNGRLFTLDMSHGLPPAIFHSAAFDRHGYLWVGTRDRGIYRSKGPITFEFLRSLDGTVESDQPDLFEPWWDVDNGAPSNQIEKMKWLNGSMWIGTPAGLAILDDGNYSDVTMITTDNGLRANNVTSFDYSSVTETVWVGTNQGLAEIDPQSLEVLNTVTRTEGLIDNEVWFYGSVHLDDNGTVFFGTARGVSIYSPQKDQVNKTAPILRLTSFTASDITGERNEFTLEYAALSFGNERQVRYQTRLIGFNDEWSPWKTDTRVNFTNLGAYFLPKTYRLEVMAQNESGITTAAPMVFEFPVNPPPLFRWWAFLIYLIILGMSVFVVDRFQRERLIRKERETANLREAELKAEAAQAQAKTLQAENDLKAAELEKARELEKAYHELQSAQTRLIQAEKMASLGRLSTGIAHEIKNPLNFINNFSEVSKELVEELSTAIEHEDHEEIEYILKNLTFNTDKINQHGKRADAIVKSMMQHSRGGKGNFEEVDLNQLIKEFSDLAYHGKKSQIHELNVKLNVDLNPDVGRVDIIPQKVGQVLQNIVENAIDSLWEHAQSQNGEFTPEILITCERANGFADIKISDNGPGIPEHIKERIFEPFFTTKPTGQGTGLGLSLSYDFITQIHSGKLELAEPELGGATFLISLPANSGSQP